jgi:DNA polymerase
MRSDWDALTREVSACRACAELAATRQRVVVGDPGPGPRARLVFVGEAPGAQEDAAGRPFVGKAGQLLDQLLNDSGMARAEVGVLNIIKCRPPGNRDPLPEEVTSCSAYLDRQVELIRPAVILLLGRHAVQRLLPGSLGISRIHGQLVERGERAYVPLYHPAAALYNGFLVDTLKVDFQKVRGYIDMIEARRSATPEPDPEVETKEQLSLFQ